MRALLVGVLCLGACSIAASAQQSSSVVEKELIAADHGIWDAIAGDHPDLERVDKALAADYVDVDSGVQHPRAEVFDYLRGLTRFTFEYRNPRATVLSPTSGYVVAEISYSSVQNGTAAQGKVLTTTVYSKEHGHWMARLHTEMEIKPEAH